MKDFRIRPYLDKDWTHVWSWIEHEGWGTGNVTIIKMGADMNHVRITVAVDENGETKCKIKATVK